MELQLIEVLKLKYLICLEKIGATTDENIDSVKDLFWKAYNVSPVYALAVLIYARDIRNGGEGRRKIFREICRELAIKKGTFSN